MKKSLSWIIKTESWSVNQFQDLNQCTHPEPLKWRGSCAILRKHLVDYQSFVMQIFLTVFPQGNFYQGHCALGKENNQTFWRLLNTGSEMTWIPGDPKCPCSSEVRVEGYGGQVINGVLSQVFLTVGPVGLMGLPTHPVVVSPTPEGIISAQLGCTHLATGRISALVFWPVE